MKKIKLKEINRYGDSRSVYKIKGCKGMRLCEFVNNMLKQNPNYYGRFQIQVCGNFKNIVNRKTICQYYKGACHTKVPLEYEDLRIKKVRARRVVIMMEYYISIDY